MEQELISKKELLEKYAISYGALYLILVYMDGATTEKPHVIQIG